MFNAILWNSYVLHSCVESIKSPHTVRIMLPLSSYKTASRNLRFTLGESICFILWSHFTVARMSKMPVLCVLINDTFWKCLLLKLKLIEFVLSIVLPREVLKKNISFCVFERLFNLTGYPPSLTLFRYASAIVWFCLF